ncbi:MAG TPA: CPBP family intramembrane glutamic endopeptidase [Chitinophagaceae bacterium]
MYDSNSKGISYTAGFFMLIAFTIAGIIFSAEITKMIWVSMTGKSFDLYLSGAGDPANSNIYKLIQVINMLGFFIPSVITAYLLNKHPLKLLGFSSRITIKQAGVVCFIIAAALFVGGGLSYFNHEIPIPAEWKASFDKLENTYNEQASAILGMKNTGDYILALLIMGFVPAFCEETLFRGGLQNFLTRSTRSPWLAIIVVSLIFSAAHFSFYGFLFRFFLGATLGLIYYFSGNLWLSILAHFINNAVVVTVYYIYTQQGKSIPEAMNDSSTSSWGLLALPVLIVLFMAFKRLSYGSELLTKQTDN